MQNYIFYSFIFPRLDYQMGKDGDYPGAPTVLELQAYCLLARLYYLKHCLGICTTKAQYDLT